jgi:hypothetical protein
MSQCSRGALRARVMRNHCPSKDRGRREDRMLVAPAASCAVKNAHELFTTGSTGATRSSLRDGVNSVVRALPGVRDLVVTVACASSYADLAPAQGCQDHTPSPSASMPLVARHEPRPSHPALSVRDDAYAPLLEPGCVTIIIILRKTEAKYFLRRGWTGILEVHLSGKSLCPSYWIVARFRVKRAYVRHCERSEAIQNLAARSSLDCVVVGR